MIDLKDKLSWELRKIVVNQGYEEKDLHAFAKRCTYMDRQIKE